LRNIFLILKTLLTFIGYFLIGYNNQFNIILIVENRFNYVCTHAFNIPFIVACSVKKYG